MLDRVHRRDSALSQTPCRATVLSSSVALPVAAVCATAGALVWIERGSADWVGMVALAGILAVSALLAAIVRLVIIDWRAEIRSSADWAAIGAESTTAMRAKDRDHGEHLHQPAVYDEVVHAILPACRHAVPWHVIEVVADVGNSQRSDQTGPSKSPGARAPWLCPLSIQLYRGHASPTFLLRARMRRPLPAANLHFRRSARARLPRQVHALLCPLR